jgi:very-short-patch-repair endonuclease
MSVQVTAMKIDKKHFTKPERRFARRLQENHIPFKVKVKINNREIDFVVNEYAIEIDGHTQDAKKNEMLAKEGYIPIHISNREVSTINISYLKK